MALRPALLPALSSPPSSQLLRRRGTTLIASRASRHGGPFCGARLTAGRQQGRHQGACGAGWGAAAGAFATPCCSRAQGHSLPWSQAAFRKKAMAHHPDM